VYRRKVGRQTLTFGVSGMLYKDALLMFDRETGTVWSHITGVALSGPMKGKQLARFAAVPQVAWKAVLKAAPNVQVLSYGGKEAALVDSYAGYARNRKALGISGRRKADPRLPGKSLVVGIVLRERALAVPWSALGDEGVVNADLHGAPLVVARSKDAGLSVAYSRKVKGRTLEFEPRLIDGRLRDKTTGTLWNLVHGVGVSGPLTDAKLESVPFVNVYWFAWADYYRQTEVFTK